MQDWEAELADHRRAIIEHELFSAAQTISDLRIFMSNHVFAVWDFMSLLKSLQNKLTCTQVPWFPPEFPAAARLINEIVTAEESDEVEPGYIVSHFDLYRSSMEQAGALPGAIDTFLNRLRAGKDIDSSFDGLEVAPNVATFVRSTISTCRLAPHEVAASFFYGREDVIPAMFTKVLDINGMADAPQFALLRLYLRRHIELDGDTHGPQGRSILTILCGNDPQKWREALKAARQSLLARKLLWDGILYAVEQTRVPQLSRFEEELVR